MKKGKINSNNSRIYDIIVRYLILLTLGLGNLFIFYFIFTPLTVNLSYVILNIFYDVKLVGAQLIVGNYIIEIIEACIAGSAYYLLLILNLSTPIKLKKRIYSILFSFSILLLLNILRIIILSIMFIQNSGIFNFTHKFFWYGLSTVFVVGIWFLTIYIYKIKEIPIYSDFLVFKKIILKN